MSEPELADKVGCTPQCIRVYESDERCSQQWTVHALNDILS